jgi:hypothetical protein
MKKYIYLINRYDSVDNTTDILRYCENKIVAEKWLKIFKKKCLYTRIFAYHISKVELTQE